MPGLIDETLERFSRARLLGSEAMPLDEAIATIARFRDLLDGSAHLEEGCNSGTKRELEAERKAQQGAEGGKGKGKGKRAAPAQGDESADQGLRLKLDDVDKVTRSLSHTMKYRTIDPSEGRTKLVNVWDLLGSAPHLFSEALATMDMSICAKDLGNVNERDSKLWRFLNKEMSNLLVKYWHPARGVVFSFGDLELGTNSGFIHTVHPFVHTRVNFSFVAFDPEQLRYRPSKPLWSCGVVCGQGRSGVVVRVLGIFDVNLSTELLERSGLEFSEDKDCWAEKGYDVSAHDSVEDLDYDRSCRVDRTVLCFQLSGAVNYENASLGVRDAEEDKGEVCFLWRFVAKKMPKVRAKLKLAPEVASLAAAAPAAGGGAEQALDGLLAECLDATGQKGEKKKKKKKSKAEADAGEGIAEDAPNGDGEEKKKKRKREGEQEEERPAKKEKKKKHG